MFWKFRAQISVFYQESITPPPPQSVQLQVGVWRNEIQTLRHPVPGQAWADGAMCISGTSGGGSKLKVALKQATEVSRTTFAPRAMQCQQNGFDFTVTEFFYLKRVSLLVV